MKKSSILLLVTIILGITACGICKPIKPQPSEQTIIHYVDSIAWHDSTIYHHIYKERYNDYTALLDTLEMSTTYSDFKSWVDTTQNTLRGTAENKDIDIPVEIKWKEKIVYRDSIQIKEIPYPVEVEKQIIKYPKTYWWFMGFTILALIYIGMKIYLKLKH